MQQNEKNCLSEKLPPRLLSCLMPFQKDGVVFAVSKNGRCLIADEMGLGKTLQAIAVACYYRSAWPLLIIVPSSLRYVWIEELEKWLPDISPRDINLIQGGFDISGISQAKVTLVTYGLLSSKTSANVKAALMAQGFGIVICDESHYFKNPQTECCQVVVPLIKAAKYCVLLSGTPALARPAEIDALMPGHFGSWWDFTKRYCNAHWERFGNKRLWNINGASNLSVLQHCLQTSLMIRREKQDVLFQLPPKYRQKVLFPLKDSQVKKEILTLLGDLKSALKRSKSVLASNLLGKELSTEGDFSSEKEKDTIILSRIQHLYSLTAEVKVGPVREYIDMLCENVAMKFVVFAYHHCMMDGLQQCLWNKKVKSIRIDGTTKPSDRQMLVQQFQSDKDTRVAILSILAAGVGLTLTEAKLVVFAELYWTPGVMLQCEDRAHRIGQTSTVAVHYLVAKDTMDEWVWAAVCKKTLITSTTLSGKSQALQADAGESYQVERLSAADVYKPADISGSEMDLSALQVHLPSDQSSILDFFSLQSQQTSQDTGGQKNLSRPSISMETTFGSSSCKKLDRNSSKSPLLGHKSVNPSKTKANQSVVFIDSSDEDNSRPSEQLKSQNIRHFETKKRNLMTRDSLSYGSDSDFEGTEDTVLPSFKKRKYTHTPRTALTGMAEISKETKPLCKVLSSGSLGFTQLSAITKSSIDYSENASTVEGEVTKWTCTLCTFSNHSLLPFCEMCETPKNSEQLDLDTSNSGHDSSCRSCSTIAGQQKHSVENTNVDYCEKPSLMSSKTETSSVPSHYWSGRDCQAFVKKRDDICNKRHSLFSSSEPKSKTTLALDAFDSSEEYVLPTRSGSKNFLVTNSDRKQKSDMFIDNGPWFPIKVNDRSDKNRCLYMQSTFTDTLQGKLNRCITKVSAERNGFACDVKNDVDCRAELVSANNCGCNRDSLMASVICSSLTIKTRDEKVCDIDSVTHSDCECDKASDSTEGTVLEMPLTMSPISKIVGLRKSDRKNQKRLVETMKENEINVKVSKTNSDLDLSQQQNGDLDNLQQSYGDFKHSEHIDSDLECLQQTNDLQHTGNDFSHSQQSEGDVDCSQQTNDLQHTDNDFSHSQQTESDVDCSQQIDSDLECSRQERKPRIKTIQSEKDDIQCTVRENEIGTPIFNNLDMKTSVEFKDSEKHKFFQFSCSQYTGRIYIFDELGNSLDTNFLPLDVEMENSAMLPELLHHPHHLWLVQTFVKQWNSLTDTKRRLISKSGSVFCNPLTEYESLRTDKTDSKQRYKTKGDQLRIAVSAAKEVNGSIRQIYRHSRSSSGLTSVAVTDKNSSELLSNPDTGDLCRRGFVQAVSADGTPLCLQCQVPCSSYLPEDTSAGTDSAWNMRFCSRSCADTYWMKTSTAYIRSSLYDIQHGICQICKIDAHSFFCHLRDTPDWKLRVAMIKSSKFAGLCTKQKQQMVSKPSAGMFWHVDHIRPVWEGGGQCDIDNLQTLCTPCHMSVTAQQASKQAKARKLGNTINTQDITSFFQKLS